MPQVVAVFFFLSEGVLLSTVLFVFDGMTNFTTLIFACTSFVDPAQFSCGPGCISPLRHLAVFDFHRFD